MGLDALAGTARPLLRLGTRQAGLRGWRAAAAVSAAYLAERLLPAVVLHLATVALPGR